MSSLLTWTLVALLAVSCASTVGLALYTARRRVEPGAGPLLGLLVSLSLWSGFYAVSLLVVPGDLRILFERLQWFGIPFVAVFVFWFAIEYTGHDELLTRRRLALLFVIPVLTVVFVWTNHLHHLVWTEQTLVSQAGIVLAVQQFGAWYWVNLLYGYGLIAAGSLLLIGLLVRSEYLYLAQSVLLLSGIAAPVVGNVVAVFVATPLPGIDVTPYALTVTGLTFGIALFRYRLFDLTPATRHVGRNAAVRDLEDGIVIVDDERAVIYCNRAAAEILELDQSSVIGDELSRHVSVDAIELGTADSIAEIEIGAATYEIRASPVTDSGDRQIGHTLMLVDITERKRHEEALARQRDQLEVLDEINRVIRGVQQTLIGTTSREEIESSVTHELAESDLYDGACVGLGVSTGEGLTCSVGEDVAPEQTDGGEDAIVSAIRNTEDVTDFPDRHESFDVSRESAIEETGRSTTVPLVYGRTVYGVLIVYTTREHAFDDRELAVLREVGEAIGYAVDAVENRQLLLSDAVTELTLAVTDDEALLVDLSTRLDCSFELEGVVPLDGDRLLVYLAVDGVECERVVSALAESGIEEARVVNDGVIECPLGSGSPLGTLVEYGANVREGAVESGRAELQIEIAPDASARTVVDRVQADFPETTMLSKSRRTPAEDDRTVESGLLDDLTDRQREVLEAAYRSGYFGWPRDSTAEEVAESLDISSPTLHNHIRKAEGVIMRELLDEES